MSKVTNKRLYSFLFAASMGTFLEFFDIALYSFSSALIAKHFFPGSEPLTAVLATWGIFALSYLVRPLGALWFGYLADMLSSRRAMVLSMGLMSLATIAIGCLPTYASIGVWAPIILLMLRMTQSVAVSPEYNLPSVFMKNNEWCQQHFGLVSSITAVVTGLGMMSASWVMSKILADQSLNEILGYQWRMPFVVAGLLVGTIGIYLRWNLDESLIGERPKHAPIKLVWSKQRKDFCTAIFIAGYVGCMSYALFSFLVHQLQTVRALTPGAALTILAKGSLLPASFSLIAGYLSDKIARNILMLSAALAMAASGYCLFTFMPSAELSQLTIYSCIMLASLGFFAGSFPGYLAELFDREYRYTGSFLAYNLGMSWIGGISPLLFIKATNLNSMLPVAIIVIYSIMIVLLMARPLLTKLRFSSALALTR